MTSLIGRKQNRRTPALAVSRAAGYALIELILVAVIIAILVSVSTPLFRRTFSDLEIRNASFNLARLISFAQQRSIADGVPYKLMLDKKKSHYRFLKLSEDRNQGYVALEGRYGRYFLLPPNIILRTDKREVIFYPDGHSDKAAITLSGRDKDIKITIKGNLGYVEFKETLF